MATRWIRRYKSKKIKANHSMITVVIKDKEKEEVVRAEIKKMTYRLDHLLQEGFSTECTIIF